jgi:hypothetical protein
LSTSFGSISFGVFKYDLGPGSSSSIASKSISPISESSPLLPDESLSLESPFSDDSPPRTKFPGSFILSSTLSVVSAGVDA